MKNVEPKETKKTTLSVDEEETWRNRDVVQQMYVENTEDLSNKKDL